MLLCLPLRIFDIQFVIGCLQNYLTLTMEKSAMIDVTVREAQTIHHSIGA